DLTEMARQIAHVIPDAPDAELAKIGEVLPDLRSVQVKLVGQRARRDRAHPGALELVEAAEIDRQAVRGELGNLVEALLGLGRPGRNGFVRPFHKSGRL